MKLMFWSTIKSSLSGASGKYFKWKEIVTDIQLLRESPAVDDCNFKILLKEWDRLIKSDTYAYVKVKGEYKLIALDGMSFTCIIQERTEGTDMMGYVTEYRWDDVDERRITVTEKEIYRGIFPPEYEPCKYRIDDISARVSCEKGPNYRFDYEVDFWSSQGVGGMAFLNSIMNFAQYLYDRIRFQMKVHRLTSRDRPSLRF